MAKSKILHFEDDSFLSGMYTGKFRLEGFDVASYENPTTDPVSVVLKENPDLIVMDIIMPVMDGFTATELIKSDDRTKNIPILGLCNLGQKEDIEKALSVGMADYLVAGKHMPSEIIEKIRSLLDASRKNQSKTANMKTKSKTLQELIDESNELSRQAGTLIPEEEWKATLKELGTFSATRSNFGKDLPGRKKEDK